MRVNAFRRTLEEFSRQARKGQISTDGNEGAALADLADQLSRRLSKGTGLKESIRSDDTISSAPAGACACCGK
jgi:hypothetical protein